MYNIGLVQLKYKGVEDFTTDFGIKARRTVNDPLRDILKHFTKSKLIIDVPAKYEDREQYIFACSHSVCEDIVSAIATLDRHAYALLGTTDQVDHNPQMYAAWANGMIYVDRDDKISRSEALPKMKRILDAGSSVLLWPEGGLNNTENLLVQDVFSGVYNLSKQTNKKVIPISIYLEHDKDELHVRYGEPIPMYEYDKREGKDVLRDSIATMMWDMIEEHSIPLVRKDLPKDARERYMELRRLEYLKNKWTRDVWDEELKVYKDKTRPLPEDVWTSFDNVELTAENAAIMGPILVKKMEYDKYNFKDYMHTNWNK